MSYRLFDYKFKCPKCGTICEGDIGGEHSMDYEIWCQKCKKELRYEVIILPLKKHKHSTKD
jgi:hypothetical protein